MSNRLTSIAADNLGSVHAPYLWTPNWVQHRLVEAFRIERRLPGGKAKPQSGSWPAITYEFADKVFWPDARERVLDAWSSAGGVYSTEVQRMEEAHDWLRLILAPYPLERACLSQWAAAMAYRRSLRGILARRGWSRTTFYRHVSAGSFVIAQRLHNDGVAVS